MTCLTSKMIEALKMAKFAGCVNAGFQSVRCVDGTWTGRTIAASTLRALSGRGLVKLFIGNEGNMAARLTTAGLDTLTLLNSGNSFLVEVGMNGKRKCIQK